MTFARALLALALSQRAPATVHSLALILGHPRATDAAPRPLAWLRVERDTWKGLAERLHAEASEPLTVDEPGWEPVPPGEFDRLALEAEAEDGASCHDCGATLAEYAGPTAGDHRWTCLRCDEVTS